MEKCHIVGDMNLDSVGLIGFVKRYSDEGKCIAALESLKWPGGFSCAKCKGGKAHHLKTRPRIFECAKCGFQNSVTAGTVFHKTRTDLSKWFLAAYMMASDKRGVSALYLSRELDLRYDTAWLMCHKLRAALFERDGFELESFVEADEAFYGGYREKGGRGRSMNDKKSMIVLAIEKKSMKRGGKTVWVAGSARIEVIANSDMPTLTDFMKRSVKPGATVLTDGWRGYNGLKDSGFRHIGMVSPGEAAGENLPLSHLMFSNIKAWLNGTFHGVSKKHLARYLREWSYRFNRRHGDVAAWTLRRMATQPGITYGALTA